MIESLFAESRSEQKIALEGNVKASTVIHESGHIIMGRRHGRVLSVSLPRIIMCLEKEDIEVCAEKRMTGVARQTGPVTDVCFGGYSADLVFLSLGADHAASGNLQGVPRQDSQQGYKPYLTIFGKIASACLDII